MSQILYEIILLWSKNHFQGYSFLSAEPEKRDLSAASEEWIGFMHVFASVSAGWTFVK